MLKASDGDASQDVIENGSLQNEQELLRYRRLFEHLDGGIAVLRVVDEYGRFIFADLNRCGEILFQVARDEIHGASVHEVFPEHLNQEFFEVLRQVWRSGVAMRQPATLYQGVGFSLWAESQICKLSESEISVLFKNMLEQKRVEEALVASESKYRQLVETLQEGVWALDAEACTTYTNPRMAEMFGYHVDEMQGRSFYSFMDPRHVDLAKWYFSRRQQGIREQHEFELQKKDGSQLLVVMESSPLLDEGGNFVGVLSGVVDLTSIKNASEEKRLMELRLQEAQKLESLGVLAGGIAHDFNNILTGILGNVSLARMSCAPEYPVLAALQRIETAAMRAADLARQMLAYSGKGRFVVQPINLSRLVEEMANLLGSVISKRAVLRFDFAPNLPLIQGDATQIRQIVMNLLTNASDAIGEKSGVVCVRTGVVNVTKEYMRNLAPFEALKEGYYVYIEVSDTGCGMDEKIKAKIFDPFFTTKFTGRGLGLAAVLGIVRGHNGGIKVYSESKRGSTFKVFFPMCDQIETAFSSPKNEIGTWRGAGKVLVIDDEESVRAVVRFCLESVGFEVFEAKDGCDGLRVFHEGNTDFRLIILDLTMPHMSGEEVFREMRTVKPNVRVCLTSGYNEQEVINLFAGKGLAGFVQKPFTAQSLIGTVRHALGEEEKREVSL